MRRIGSERVTCFPNGIDISDAGDVLIGDSHGNQFHVAVYDKDAQLVSQFVCPNVKVSRYVSISCNTICHGEFPPIDMSFGPRKKRFVFLLVLSSPNYFFQMLWAQNYYGGLHRNAGKEQSSRFGAKHTLRVLRISHRLIGLVYHSRSNLTLTENIFILY